MKANNTPLPPVQFLEAAGIRTAYYRGGKGEPVVLLHGGGAGADSQGNWSACWNRFTERFDTIAMDMVGFGFSDKPDPASYEYTQDGRTAHVAAAIRELDIGPVHIIGNSMGGLTALGVAVEHPELVRSIVLMGSAGIRTELNPALKSIMNYDFSLEGMHRIVEALTNSGFQVDSQLVSYRHRLSLDPETKAAYVAIQGWIRDRGGLYCEEDYIAAVSVPTLVVNGKEDKVIPITSAFRFLELIPHAWGFLIPRCGHWAMMEYPEAFCRTAIGFISEHSGKT